MHPLHDYIARQLAGRVKARAVVIWYDPRGEFWPFVQELRGEAETSGVTSIIVDGTKASLVAFAGSLFEIRAAVEPLVAGEHPQSIVVYVSGPAPEPAESVLLELEMAGDRYEPQLKRLARNLLRERFTDGGIDELLERDGVTYEDLARAAEPDGGDEPPSILKGIFSDAAGRDDLIAAWLAGDDQDEEITNKGAVGELARLIRSRVGLELDAADAPAKLRSISVRFLLANEFRDDLKDDAPGSLAVIPRPGTKPHADGVRALLHRLRVSHAAAYVELADRVEAELGLSHAAIAADRLGSTDTFRFEERAVLAHVHDLIAAGEYAEAGGRITERETSFWLDLTVSRRAQWQACRLMADLGQVAADVMSTSTTAQASPDWLIARYADREGGWYRLDQAQRRLETLVASLDEEPAERPLGLVRRAYSEAARRLADRFVPAFGKAGWSAAGTMHQTRVFADVVAAQPKPVAYFLVDAMRYEMGVELMERLPVSAEATITPAVAALPSITPIGMAALMPGAAASFDVVDSGAKLGARIDGTFLPDLTARRKFAASRIPSMVDLTLGEVLGISAQKLEARVAGAEVVIVRSQEIDDAGEGGFEARRRMDTVIDDLVRAIRKLAAAGVRHAVASADHGHLFGHADLDEAQRADAPGGATVDLHRRCWIGRGGATPPGCIRVAASTLGYDSDLDLVFPPGTSVFKAGGDLAFHHGGPTLQELIVPVLTVRSALPIATPKSEPASVTGVPEVITNRIFSAVVQLGGQNLAMFSGPTPVQPVLRSGPTQVGKAAMAVGAELDLVGGTIIIAPGSPVTIGFMLTDDSVDALRIVIVDPATDAELYRSPHDIPVKLGVG